MPHHERVMSCTAPRQALRAMFSGHCQTLGAQKQEYRRGSVEVGENTQRRAQFVPKLDQMVPMRRNQSMIMVHLRNNLSSQALCVLCSYRSSSSLPPCHLEVRQVALAKDLRPSLLIWPCPVVRRLLLRPSLPCAKKLWRFRVRFFMLLLT